MRVAAEGRIPIALASDAGAKGIGRRLFADAALREMLWRASMVFLPLALVTALGFFFIYHVTATANRRVLEAGQEKIVQMGRATVNASMNALAADVAFLAEDGTLRQWIDFEDPVLGTLLAGEYLNFIRHKRQYDQLRFMDASGHERVRADRHGGNPRIVAQDELQDKSGRPYFVNALNLEAGEIYISPLDLNVENGAIEQPIKPTVRIAMPVTDSAGRKHGIVVLNYLAERILNRIRGLGSEGENNVWLVNSDGYWLIGPRPDVEWSFVHPGQAEFKFAGDYPSAWERIKGTPGFGQFAEAGGLFSYVPLFAPATSEEGVTIASAPLWYLIAHVPASIEKKQLAGVATNLGIAFGAALILLAAVAVLIGHHGARRRQAETEVRLLNAKLASDNDSLQMLNRELEAFSYSVSHDLRTPLRAIDGFSKALLDDYAQLLDQSGRDHLVRVRNAAQRMGKLIDDLLQLSQVGRSEINIVDDVDLTEIASTVVETLRRMDPARDIEFVAEPRIQARCDSRLLRIVLENLLNNAWKFTAGTKSAVIEFGTTEAGGSTAYFVRDNGMGFDMAHAGKLFGAFQRLHSNGEFPGTGIGLATVAKIVRKHGGRVWAEAVPNEGATLYFTL